MTADATIQKISIRNGGYVSKISLNLLHEGLVLEEGVALSLREVIFSTRPDLEGILELGEAKCRIGWPGGPGSDGRRCYGFAIESTSIPDFIALYREVLKRFGQKHEHVAPSLHTTPPNEQSFVRGLANDLHNLKRFVAARVSGARRRLGFKIFAH